MDLPLGRDDKNIYAVHRCMFINKMLSSKMSNYNFYVYITTNPTKTVLYIGVTNDLTRRVLEHTENKGNKNSFAGKFYCHNLIYFEHFTHIEYAIQREKELKKWSRKKKTDLIATMNPNWRFLNDEVMEK